jgi:hypothetical protein
MKKLLDAQIIIPLRYSVWVAHLVLVRNKSGEIRLCVDFKNLNKFSLKYNYPLPKMDHIMQKLVGVNMISMTDGFSGYNQLAMHLDEREKTSFTTPCGTFMYEKIPFGLINAGETFQRDMDIAFVGERDKFIFIYLDDMTIFSKIYEDHIKNLKKTFEKCRKFGLFFNPKKYFFSMEEGIFFGHIVSKGVRIDPKRVEEIKQIYQPRNKKEVQYFLGKIGFLRMFVPNFIEMVKDITNMMKKDNEVKWAIEDKQSFR